MKALTWSIIFISLIVFAHCVDNNEEKITTDKEQRAERVWKGVRNLQVFSYQL